MSINISLFTIPNAISVARLLTAPALLVIAWLGYETLFFYLFLASLLSDALDGYLARQLNQVSELGTKLDSWGDLALYAVAPLSIYWLWPEIIFREIVYITIALVSFILPILIGLVKFHRITSYHTIGAKLSSVFFAVSLPLILLDGPAWPFRMATLLFTIAEIEEIAITLRLTSWQSNIPSFFYLLLQNGANK